MTNKLEKHIVTYIGKANHTDKKGVQWNKSDSHEFDTLEDRSDIQFMIGYGEMTLKTVSFDVKNEQSTEKEQENTSETAVVEEPKAIEEPVKVVLPKEVFVGEVANLVEEVKEVKPVVSKEPVTISGKPLMPTTK